MKKILIFLLNVYQKTFSPDHSWLSAYFPHGYCRYTPSCSEYAKQALVEYNLFVAIYLSVWRVLRCNPWARFGPDPLPSGNFKLR